MPAKNTYYKKKLWKKLEEMGITGDGLAAFVDEACWLLIAVEEDDTGE